MAEGGGEDEEGAAGDKEGAAPETPGAGGRKKKYKKKARVSFAAHIKALRENAHFQVKLHEDKALSRFMSNTSHCLLDASD